MLGGLPGGGGVVEASIWLVENYRHLYYENARNVANSRLKLKLLRVTLLK